MAVERVTVGSSEWRSMGYSHVQRYLFARERISGRVLDAACGAGFGSYLLAETGEQVTALDVSAEALAEVRTHHQRTNIQLHLGGVESLPKGEVFNAVVSFETIEHVPDPRAFLQEIHDRLLPGGRLILSAPNFAVHRGAPQPRENEFHLNEPVYDDLLRWLHGLFRVDETWEQAHQLAPYHHALAQGARDGARVSQLMIVRLAAALERSLRRMVGRTLPEPLDLLDRGEGMVADSFLLPLLPQRRAIAHTFLIAATKIA